MKQRAVVLGTALVTLSMIGSAVLGQEEGALVTDRDRVFANFTREAATVGKGSFRLELRGLRIEDDGSPQLDVRGFSVREREEQATAALAEAELTGPCIAEGAVCDRVEVSHVNGGFIDLLASYGLGRGGEVGVAVPLVFQEIQTEARGTAADGSRIEERFSSENDEDIGDITLYGKWKHMATPECALATGFELTVPTGDANDGVGTDHVSVNPFVSTRYQRGRVGVGAHIGYQVWDDAEIFDDTLNYSGHLILRGGENYALRAEVSGRFFRHRGEDIHDIVLLPGIDYNVTDHITVRPTGLTHLNGTAFDWGIGVGIAARM